MGYWIFKALGMSLLLTLVFEVPFAFLVRIREWKDLLLVVLVNVLTNPCVVSVHYLTLLYTSWNQMAITAMLEALAVIVEGICYQRFGEKIAHPFLLSVSANIFSYFSGEVINHFI